MAYGEGGLTGAMSAREMHLRESQAMMNSLAAEGRPNDMVQPAEGRVRSAVSRLYQIAAHLESEGGQIDLAFDRLAGSDPKGNIRGSREPRPISADLDDLDDAVQRIADFASALSMTAKRAAAL